MNEANTAAATPGDLERAAQDKMIEDNLEINKVYEEIVNRIVNG